MATANDGELLVALDPRLTPELVAEGRAREVVNRLQTARKEAGLDYADRIRVRYSAAPELEAAIATHRDWISGETLAGRVAGRLEAATRRPRLPRAESTTSPSPFGHRSRLLRRSCPAPRSPQRSGPGARPRGQVRLPRRDRSRRRGRSSRGLPAGRAARREPRRDDLLRRPRARVARGEARQRLPARPKIRLRWYDGGAAGLARGQAPARRAGARSCAPAGWRSTAASSRAGASRRRRWRRFRRSSPSRARPSLAGLRPAVHLSYRRERFVEPASGLRIALDSEISPLRIAGWAASAPGIRRVPGNLRSPCLVELKGASRDLPPALAALASLGGRRESFSKYSFCLLD